MIKFSEEEYSTIIKDINILFPDFLSEIDKDGEDKPEIDHDTLLNVPQLQTITARDDDELVGFHLAIISNDVLYKSVLTSCVIMYYFLPKYRGVGNGFNMFMFAENLYKEKEVNRVFMSRRIHIDNERLFNKLNYSQIEANYTKVLR